MFLKSLHLQNFRNFTDKRLEFKDGLNFIIAPNGAGKTNVLEAIYLLAYTKSPRNLGKEELVNWESAEKAPAFFKIKGEIVEGCDQDDPPSPLGLRRTGQIDQDDLNDQNGESGRRVDRLDLSRKDPKRLIRDRLDRLDHSTTLELLVEKTNTNSFLKTTYKVNGVRRSSTKFRGNFFCVLFSPLTINLVGDSPSVRRVYFDQFLSLVDEEYGQVLAEYKGIVRQRNRVLKSLREGRAGPNELSYWDMGLVEKGSSLIEGRLDLLKEIKALIQEFASEVFSEEGSLTLSYLTKLGHEDVKESFENKVEKGREKEVGAGVTLYGPHRDDFEFDLNDRPLASFGSRGQQRLGILAIVLALWKYLGQIKKVKPVLLLDDILSELDRRHQKNVIELARSLGTQAVMTGTQNVSISSEKDLEKNKVGVIEELV